MYGFWPRLTADPTPPNSAMKLQYRTMDVAVQGAEVWLLLLMLLTALCFQPQRLPKPAWVTYWQQLQTKPKG